MNDHEVLVDVFEIIKEVVLDNEAVEKKRQAAMQKIGETYNQKPSDAASAKVNITGRDGDLAKLQLSPNLTSPIK